MNIDFGRPSEPRWMDITPAMAAEMLQRNTGNRPIKKTHLKGLVSEIANGRFMETGDSIKFSNTGLLLDGQHRLQACVDAGATIRTIVACGLSPEIFTVLDSGAKRSVANMLEGLGHANPNDLGAAVKVASVIAGMWSGSSWWTLSNARFSGNDALQGIADGAFNFDDMHLSGHARKLCVTHSALMAFIALGRRSGIQTSDLVSFIARCAEGNDISHGDPRLALKAFTTHSRNLPYNTRTYLIVSRLIRAYTAFENGEQILRLQAHSMDRAFPRFTTSNPNKEQS